MKKSTYRTALITSIVLWSVLLIMPTAGMCQEDSSPIFIVYGMMYKYGTAEPMDFLFTIEVENMRNGLTNYTELGASGEVGTFSVVLIDYQNSDAVQLGDSIVVRAKPFNAADYALGTTFIISQNGFQNRMMHIDFEVEDPYSTEPQSWGAIKRIFRASR